MSDAAETLGITQPGTQVGIVKKPAPPPMLARPEPKTQNATRTIIDDEPSTVDPLAPKVGEEWRKVDRTQPMRNAPFVASRDNADALAAMTGGVPQPQKPPQPGDMIRMSPEERLKIQTESAGHLPDNSLQNQFYNWRQEVANPAVLDLVERGGKVFGADKASAWLSENVTPVAEKVGQQIGNIVGGQRPESEDISQIAGAATGGAAEFASTAVRNPLQATAEANEVLNPVNIGAQAYSDFDWAVKNLFKGDVEEAKRAFESGEINTILAATGFKLPSMVREAAGRAVPAIGARMDPRVPAPNQPLRPGDPRIPATTGLDAAQKAVADARKGPVRTIIDDPANPNIIDGDFTERKPVAGPASQQALPPAPPPAPPPVPPAAAAPPPEAGGAAPPPRKNILPEAVRRELGMDVAEQEARAKAAGTPSNAPVSRKTGDMREIFGNLVRSSTRLPKADVEKILDAAINGYDAFRKQQGPAVERYSLGRYVDKNIDDIIARSGVTISDVAKRDIRQAVRGRGRAAHGGGEGVGDTSRATMSTAIGDLRKTQKEWAREQIEGKDAFNKTELYDQKQKIKKSAEEMGREVYGPTLDWAGKLWRKEEAVTPTETKALEKLKEYLNRAPFKSEMPKELKILTELEDVPLEKRIDQNPADTAHWLQSKLGQLAESARASNNKGMAIAYDAMRDKLLEQIETALPAYAKVRADYGDEFRTLRAGDWGKGWFADTLRPEDVAERAADYGKMTDRQKTIARMSTRDEIMSIFEQTPEEAALRLSKISQEGNLKALEEVFGKPGKKVADTIREIRDEALWLNGDKDAGLQGIDSLSGSNSIPNAQNLKNDADAVRNGIQKGVTSFGDRTKIWGAALADAALMFGSHGAYNTPMLTAGVAGSKGARRILNPSPRKMANATDLMFSNPKPTIIDEAVPPPPKPKKTRGPAKEGTPLPETMRELQEAYAGANSKSRRRAIGKKMAALHAAERAKAKVVTPEEVAELFRKAEEEPPESAGFGLGKKSINVPGEQSAPEVGAYAKRSTIPVGGVELAPRDILLAYNEPGRTRDRALALGLDPEKTNVVNRLGVAETFLRQALRPAVQAGQVDELAAAWRVTPDEIESFVKGRGPSHKGDAEQKLNAALDVIEKAGRPISLEAVSQRTGTPYETLKQYMSAANNAPRDGKNRVKLSDAVRARVQSARDRGLIEGRQTRASRNRKTIIDDEDKPEPGAVSPRAPDKSGVGGPQPKKTMAVMHNLTEQNLFHANELGGLAAPSLAVVDTEKGALNNFGDISLIADPEFLKSKGVRTFDADIYSPRHPRAEHKIVEKAARAAEAEMKAATAEYGDLRDIDWDSVAKEGSPALARNERVQAAFLKSRGEMPTRLPRRKLPDGTTPEHKAAAKLVGDKSFWEARENPEIMRLARQFFDSEVEKMRRVDPAEADDMLKTYIENEDGKEVLHRNFVHRFVNDAKLAAEAMSGKVDSIALSQMMSKKLRNKATAEAFETYVDDLAKRTSDGKRLFRGFTYSGNRKYGPYNMEAVLDEMTKALQGGEGWNYGAGSIRAKYAREMKSIEEIRNRKDQLVPEGEMEAAKEGAQAKLSALLEDLKPYYRFKESNPFIAYDDMSKAIGEGPKGIREAFDFKGNPEPMQRIKEFIDELRNMPTEYFEAKANRAVGLDEFKVAVVPRGTSQKAIDLLKSKGLEIRFYKRGDAASRQAAIRAAKAHHFSNRTGVPELAVGAASGVYAYNNPSDANGDGVIDDKDRGMSAFTSFAGTAGAIGAARTLMRGPGKKSAIAMIHKDLSSGKPLEQIAKKHGLTPDQLQRVISFGDADAGHRFVTKDGTEYAVDIDDAGHVTFNANDGPRAPKKATTDEFKPTGKLSLGEAREVFSGVEQAIKNDIIENARPRYVMQGRTPKQKSVYASMAKRKEAPAGYDWKIGDSSVELVKKPQTAGFGLGGTPEAVSGPDHLRQLQREAKNDLGRATSVRLNYDPETGKLYASNGFDTTHGQASQMLGLEGDLRAELMPGQRLKDLKWHDASDAIVDPPELFKPKDEGMLVYRGSSDDVPGVTEAGRLGLGKYAAEDPEIGAEWGGQTGKVDAYRVKGKLFDLDEETAQGLENYAKQEDTPAAQALKERLKKEGYVGIRDPFSGHINVFDESGWERVPDADKEIGSTWTNDDVEMAGFGGGRKMLVPDDDTILRAVKELTAQEFEVFKAARKGGTNAEVAARINASRAESAAIPANDVGSIIARIRKKGFDLDKIPPGPAMRDTTQRVLDMKVAGKSYSDIAKEVFPDLPPKEGVHKARTAWNNNKKSVAGKTLADDGAGDTVIDQAGFGPRLQKPKLDMSEPARMQRKIDATPSGAQKMGNLGKPLPRNVDGADAIQFYFGEVPDWPFYLSNGKREAEVLRREAAGEWNVEKVKLEDITFGGQQTLHSGFRDVPGNGGFEGKPPVLVRERGKLLIRNGNHRLVAAAERGDKTIEAGIIDLDATSSQSGSSKLLAQRSFTPKGDKPFSSPLLSHGENKTAEMLLNGYTYADIADELDTSVDVVKKHAERAQKKLGDETVLPRPGMGKRPPGTTKREAANALFEQGLDNATIAARTGLSIGNVRTYRSYWKQNSGSPVVTAQGGAYNPPKMPERPFEADYPQKDWPEGVPTDAQGRLKFDMEGRPLDQNSVIVGRNKAPGHGPQSEADRPLRDKSAVIQTTKQVGNDFRRDPRDVMPSETDGYWHPSFAKDGRYTGRGSAVVADDLDRPVMGLDDQELIAIAHELAHSIDFKAKPARNVAEFSDRKWGIDHNGPDKAVVEDQLLRIYQDLNNAPDGEVKFKTPADRGYDEVDGPRELWAEAIRAYMHDPNYIKTVAPEVAFLIRKHVNKKSSIRKAIQFNAVPIIGGAAIAGTLAGRDERTIIDE